MESATPKDRSLSVWPVPLSLATTYGISFDFFGLFRFRSPLLTESRLISLPEATEMFQFTSSLHIKLWIHFMLNTRLTYPGSPIRKSADLSVCATPRSLSQLVTSFIDDRCQGIRPALLVT